MTDEQKAELEKLAGSSVLPHRTVVHAKALVWAGEGVSNEGNARRSGERVLELSRSESPPGDGTHWATRSVAAHLGVGKGTVAQVWRDHGLKPWKVDTFKISTDP